ncbi:MAG: Ldh family oxidoreductase, partial [Promethearchaeota archaeon]
MSDDITYIDANTLKSFMSDVFLGLGVPKNDAEIISDVLITADIKGIDSHGV